MDPKNPRTGQSARASKSTAADVRNPTNKPASRQYAAYRVAVTEGLWRGFEVSPEPPTAKHQYRTFRSQVDALAYAEALAKCEGRPIIDRAGRAA